MNRRRNWEAVEETGEFRIDRDDAVAVITIDRVEARNALTLDAQAELVRTWRAVQRDTDVRAVVVTGASDPGRADDDQAFCAGTDVKELEEEARHGNTFAGHPLDEGFPSLAGDQDTTPTIAAVNGLCIGGGMTLMLATDLRVVSTGATFSLPEVKLGGIPGNGGIRRAVSQLPQPVALELLLLGTSIGAAKAHELGLVNAVVPPSEVLPTAMEWARRVALLPHPAVTAAVELAKRSPEMTRADAARLERVFMGILQRNDVLDGDEESS